MLTARKRKIIFWASVAAFFLLMPIVILYALGYRLDDGWNLQKTGGLYVTSDITGSSIYIDEKLIRTTNLLQGGAFVDSLAPGNYIVSVQAENYLPWEKNLSVRSQLVSEAKALLIPYKNNVRILVQGTFSSLESSPLNNLLLFTEEKNNEKIVRWYIPERNEFLTDTGPLLKYKNDFELIRWLPQGAVLKLDGRVVRIRFNIQNRTAASVPLGDEPAIKSSEEIELVNNRFDDGETVQLNYSPESGSIKAIWLESTILPYYFQKEEEVLFEGKRVRDFQFFPGRRDAILASYENGVWAIEIDSRGGRIIHPVYKGREPEFGMTAGTNKLYILDAGNLIELSLRLED